MAVDFDPDCGGDYPDDPPYLPFSALLGFTPLPASLMALLLLINLLYVVAAELTKKVFYARHGMS
jgi:hypothetical protein